MLSFILPVIFAAIIAFLVTLEASSTNMYLGATVLVGVPLFFVVFVSMLVGMLLTSVNTIKNIIQSKITIFGQRSDLKKSFRTMEELQAKVDKLEDEKLLLKEKIKLLDNPPDNKK